MRSVKICFEHLNKLGVRATMDSKLEEHRSVIQFLFLEGKKTLLHFSKVAEKFFESLHILFNLL